MSIVFDLSVSKRRKAACTSSTEGSGGWDVWNGGTAPLPRSYVDAGVSGMGWAAAAAEGATARPDSIGRGGRWASALTPPAALS